MAKHYAIVHFWPARDGFRKRMELLAEALSPAGRMERIRTPSQLLRLTAGRAMRRGEVSLIVYTSLLAPLVWILKLLRRDLPVYYMVRGDEVTWAQHANRPLRARAGRALQRLMVRLRCRFVFASADLHETFVERLGPIAWARVLPNTLGEPLPDIRPFDGRLAVVGDFASVKNIECVIECLAGGEHRVDLYGNRSMPDAWKRPWLHAHGFVRDLKSALGKSSLLVLASVSEGSPNVLLDALQAGCGVVVHRGFPFRRLPVAEQWRFRLNRVRRPGAASGRGAADSADLPSVLRKLRSGRQDFKRANPALIRLVESDWRRRVLDVFA